MGENSHDDPGEYEIEDVVPRRPQDPEDGIQNQRLHNDLHRHLCPVNHRLSNTRAVLCGWAEVLWEASRRTPQR